jgi:5-methylcytosine-specific restriction enzyme A
MPHRALQVCATGGCPELVERGHCDTHRRARRRTQAQARRAQGDPSMGGGRNGAYRGKWPTRRAAFLAKHPSCVDCGAPATEPDHVPPRQLLVALGINDPDDDQWLRPRCKADHSKVTASRDKPLLARWEAGEDPAVLAEEAMRHG